MVKPTWLAFVCLLFVPYLGLCQALPGYDEYKRFFNRNEPDSLDALATRIASISSDTCYIKLIRTTAIFRRDDWNSCLPALDSLVHVAGDHQDVVVGIAFRLRSVVLSALGEHERAVKDADAGIKRLSDPIHAEEIMALWVVKADALIALEKLDRAVECLSVAQRMANTIPSARGRCMVHISMGMLRFKQQRYAEARVDFAKALTLATEHDFTRMAYSAMGNLAGVATMTEEYDLAIQLYDSLLSKMGQKSPEMRSRMHGQKGFVALQQGDALRASISCRLAIAIADSTGDLANAADARHDLAYAMWDLHGAKEALPLMEDALTTFKTLGWTEREKAAHYDLYLMLKTLGQHERSAIHLERYTEILDTLQQARFAKDLARSEVVFETERKDHRIAEQEQALALAAAADQRKSIQRNAFIGATLLLALIALLLFRTIRTRKRLARKEKELHGEQVDQLLSQQEIKSINAMLEGQEKERDRMAKDLHDRLGSMLGGIKANVSELEDRVERISHDQQYVKVNKLLDQAVGELRQISHDMAAATLSRFGLEKALNDLRDTIHINGRLTVELKTFGLDHRLERSVELAVYRMVQELVANVLKHAHARELSIGVTRSPGRLSVVVADDGQGFDTRVPSEGMGLSNVRSRASALGATAQVDSTPGKGTTVSVECPVVE